MDASRVIFGRLGRFVSSHLRVRNPHPPATTGTAAATSAVASTALASTPAVSSTTGPYYFDAVPGAQDIIKHLVFFLGENELFILSSFNEVAAKKGKQVTISEWAQLGVALIPEDIPPVPNHARLKPHEFFVLIPKGISVNKLNKIECIKDSKDDYAKKATESFYWVAGAVEAKLPNQPCANPFIQTFAVTLIYEVRRGERKWGMNPSTTSNPWMEKKTLLKNRLI
jgi:hypothetical protein